MDTPAQDAAPLTAAPGLVLDDRYRLDQVRADRQPPAGLRSMLWRAIDDSLGRFVAVEIVLGADARRRKRIVKAATRASTVADARFVRVYDVGEVELDGRQAVWVANEWVDAPTLAAIVRDEPLSPPVATDLGRQCAEAVAAAAALGISHGRLTPDRVHVPASGTVRISGLATAAAVHDIAADEAGDVRALGGILFAALTGRWPLAGWQGLPMVAGTAGSGGHPRAVRAGVPRELDTVTSEALTGRFGSATSLAMGLRALPSQAIDAVPEQGRERRPDVLRRWLWRLVPPLLVITIGIAGWQVGSELGRVPLVARQPHAAVPPAKQTGPQHNRVTLVWHQPPTVTSFDPQGDQVENPDATGLAVDRDPTTAWTTDRYATAGLGGLKPGVGLLLDLGRPRDVSVADLVLSAAGADVEIHAGDRAPTEASDLPLVAKRANAPDSVRLNLPHAVTARYWLVWFTKLPPDGGGFRVGVAEVALLG